MKVSMKVDSEVSSKVSVFDLPPPIYPARVVSMTFEYQTDFTHVIFSGNTKPFQPGFVSLNIKGQSVKANPKDQYGEYYRVIKDLNISTPAESLEYLKEILGEKVLKNTPVILQLKGDKAEKDNIQEIMDCLKECENVRIRM